MTAVAHPHGGTTKMTINTRAISMIKRKRASVPGIGDSDASNEGRGRTALVTGASAGIGWSLAELFAAKGYDVVVVARREVRLKELQDQLERRWGVRVLPIPYDLGEPDAPRHIRDELVARDLSVDFLVNNAGYTLPGAYTDIPWEDHLRWIRVMALGVAELCHYTLPHMVDQRWGRVINVSSVGGVASGSPGMVLYCATKAFVNKFTEGLAAEYEPHGVNCTASLPGSTETEIFAATGISEYADSNLFMQLAMMRSETVARQAYAACMQGRRLIIHGGHHKAWAFAMTHAPPKIRYSLVKFVAEMSKP